MDKKRIIAILLAVLFLSSMFSQTVIEIEPYTQENIPEWAYDARRFSIVSLGSIPFTTLATTLGYTVYRYISNDFNADYVPNPFPTSSTAAMLNQDEQIGILITAASIGLVIGIADLIIIKIKENNEKKATQADQAERVIVTPMIEEKVETE